MIFVASILIHVTAGRALLQSLESDTKHRLAKSKLDLDVWKYDGDDANFYKAFKSVTIDIRSFIESKDNANMDDNIFLYQANNESELMDKFESGQRIFGFLHKWSLWKSSKLNPFEPRFVGVETMNAYKIGLNLKNPDIALLLIFCAGALLFTLGKKISRNVLAFYMGGSTMGIILSILLVLFVLYKFLPMKKGIAAFSTFTGVASINFYILYLIWCNVFDLLASYQRFVAIYVALIGAVSFAFCYKVGPPKDVKSQNLIQWFIQIFGLVLMYNACQIRVVALGSILLLVAVVYLKQTLKRIFRRMRLRFFRPTQRLLTEEEYYKQGSIETKKALEELRRFCKSPGCDSWKYMSTLKSPGKFASFVSGGSDVNDTELQEYDSYSVCRDADASATDDEEEYSILDSDREFYPNGHKSKSCFDRSLPALSFKTGYTFEQSSFSLTKKPAKRFYESMAAE